MCVHMCVRPTDHRRDRRTDRLIVKTSTRHEQTFHSKENPYKCMKDSAALVTRETQMKATVRYYFIPARLAEIMDSAGRTSESSTQVSTVRM